MARPFRKPYDCGDEKLDPTPVAKALGLSRPPTLEERIFLFLRTNEMANAANRSGLESFEEADDFDVEDPEDFVGFVSPYEENFDHLSNLDSLKEQISENRDGKKKEQRLKSLYESLKKKFEPKKEEVKPPSEDSPE